MSGGSLGNLQSILTASSSSSSSQSPVAFNDRKYSDYYGNLVLESFIGSNNDGVGGVVSVAVFQIPRNDFPSRPKNTSTDTRNAIHVTRPNRLADDMFSPMGFVMAVLLHTARSTKATLDAMAVLKPTTKRSVP